VSSSGKWTLMPPGSDVTTGTRRITASFAKLYPPDGEGKICWGRLKKSSRDWLQ